MEKEQRIKTDRKTERGEEGREEGGTDNQNKQKASVERWKKEKMKQE